MNIVISQVDYERWLVNRHRKLSDAYQNLLLAGEDMDKVERAYVTLRTFEVDFEKELEKASSIVKELLIEESKSEEEPIKNKGGRPKKTI